MKRKLWVSVISLVLLAAPSIADPQRASDPRVADLVQAGRVRFALFPPQYTKDPLTGELKGVWADVARELAARIGVQAVLIEHRTPPEMVACLKSGACDVGFLGYDPARAAAVEGFSPAFIEFDYTYLVPNGSPIRSVADADRPGIRIVVVNAHASTLALNRLRKGRVDAWASARQALVDYSVKLGGSRVLEDRYGANRPAVVVARGQTARLAYISEFIEEIKASGFVQQSISRSGWRGVQVAAPARK
jgi:polar amino acid transport system substrate-binding protein